MDGTMVLAWVITSIMNLFLDSCNRTIREFLVLEHCGQKLATIAKAMGNRLKLTERQLLKGSSICLRVEAVDKYQFEENPATEDGKILPIEFTESDGVDVGREETSSLAENLLDSNTARTDVIGEEFDKVGC